VWRLCVARILFLIHMIQLPKYALLFVVGAVMVILFVALINSRFVSGGNVRLEEIIHVER
jgi:hypothetical protein